MQTPPAIEMLPIGALKPYAGNARTHSRKQLRQISDSIKRFGFTNPVLISDEGEIVAGHGRVLAARDLGLRTVPTLRLSHLSAEERRAYVLADNKLALNAGWDIEILSIELQTLIDLEFDVTLTGFSLAEIDLTLDQAREQAASGSDAPEDAMPELADQAVTCLGDVWLLGEHRLLCGDSRLPDDLNRLMGDERADLIFTDPPYNVPIDGHVGGLGSIHHRDFAFASGEMTSAQFEEFLKLTLGNAASQAKDGAIAFVCMDWRHMRELLDAGEEVFTEFKNLCVWNKTNGGMGSFYRSKHELVFVFKVGTAPHTNSFGLGETGRYRTNVWDYAGISSLGANRSDELTMHPTVKPVALVADAIKDCSRRGEIVLDVFGGSGIDADRRHDLRATSSSARVRPALLRHHREAMADVHGQTRGSRGHWHSVRGRRAGGRRSARSTTAQGEEGGGMSEAPKNEISEEAIDEAKRRILFGASYARPPKEHQFKKGQSGNPKGRPKAQDSGGRSSHSIALREAERLVTVREGDTVHQITQIDAVHRAQYVVATKGSAYAQKHIIDRYERARHERRREIDANKEAWRTYVERESAKMEEAAKQGIMLPPVLPHPDDVVIDPDGVRFIGPWDEASAARLEETVRLRDVLLTQAVWDERHGRGEGESRVTVAGICAQMFNDAVPARRRLSDIDCILRLSRLQGTSKRELRKLLFRQWKEVGLRWTENLVFPSIDRFRWQLDQVMAAYRQLEAEDGPP